MTAERLQFFDKRYDEEFWKTHDVGVENVANQEILVVKERYDEKPNFWGRVVRLVKWFFGVDDTLSKVHGLILKGILPETVGRASVEQLATLKSNLQDFNVKIESRNKHAWLAFWLHLKSFANVIRDIGVYSNNLTRQLLTCSGKISKQVPNIGGTCYLGSLIQRFARRAELDVFLTNTLMRNPLARIPAETDEEYADREHLQRVFRWTINKMRIPSDDVQVCKADITELCEGIRKCKWDHDPFQSNDIDELWTFLFTNVLALEDNSLVESLNITLHRTFSFPEDEDLEDIAREPRRDVGYADTGVFKFPLTTPGPHNLEDLVQLSLS